MLLIISLYFDPIDIDLITINLTSVLSVIACHFTCKEVKSVEFFTNDFFQDGCIIDILP